MMRGSDKWILKGIRNNNSAVLNYLYAQYADKTAAYIRSRGGSDKDAEDLFQEALVLIYEKSKDKSFAFEKSFDSYLITVVKFMHHKQIRRRKTHNEFLHAAPQQLRYTPAHSFETKRETRYRVILKNYFNLSKACMKILRLVGRGFSNEQISKELHHKGESITRVQKHRCMKYLADLVKKDSDTEW